MVDGNVNCYNLEIDDRIVDGNVKCYNLQEDDRMVDGNVKCYNLQEVDTMVFWQAYYQITHTKALKPTLNLP